MTIESATRGQAPIEYEFTDIENDVIRDLTSKMSFVGTVSAVLGVILLGLGGLGLIALGASRHSRPADLVNVVTTGVQGVVLILIGVWTRSATASFKLIVDTEGNDIGNLMFALGHMRRISGLQRAMLSVALALMVIALAVLFANIS